ncbi:helix-turn-helix domain-containing protein [Streptomyces sp. NPDC058401]|uniref:helix-turn-helix domain-containing protein n=1 Tax=Streptomyces sp. NPDC058401 TaxID=3346480 RepID=UPI00365ADB47
MVKPSPLTSSLHNVAVAVVNGVTPFEMGIFCEVFGVDRSAMGLPTYDFALCAMEDNPITAGDGHYRLTLPYGPERLEEADLVCLPADREAPTRVYPEPLLEALRRAVDRGARVLSVCSGAFMLGAAGLLDDRRCTTHWMHAPALARRFPRARVDPDVLYVDEGQVITSAGTASGIDACLHLVRQEQGSEVANTIARRMVVPPHRDGGQAQYIRRPLPRTSCDTVGEVIGWMARHLDEEITVEQLAERAHMSARTFARRFLQETGTTPYQWVLRQRVLLAQELLEATDETVDAIAGRCGFGTAAALRHHFLRTLNTTPNAFRRTFRGPSAA